MIYAGGANRASFDPGERVRLAAYEGFFFFFQQLPATSLARATIVHKNSFATSSGSLQMS